MLGNLILVSVFIFLVGFWVFISNRKHLINILISLEYIVLAIFILILVVNIKLGLEIFILLIFLVARVCEGSLGVRLIVRIVRSHGSDQINSFRVLKC